MRKRKLDLKVELKYEMKYEVEEDTGDEKRVNWRFLLELIVTGVTLLSVILEIWHLMVNLGII